MAVSRVKVIAEVPEELRNAIDELGPRADLTMGQIVREALERFMPILRQRVAERERATAVEAVV
jgi:hypothetical protein